MSADRIMALADSGTPGPWAVGEITPGTWAEHIPAYADIEPMIAGGIDTNDAAKIVSAVNALPKVAAYDAAVEALQVHQALCTGPYLCEGCEEAWDDVHGARDDLIAALGVDSE